MFQTVAALIDDRYGTCPFAAAFFTLNNRKLL